MYTSYIHTNTYAMEIECYNKDKDMEQYISYL